MKEESTVEVQFKVYVSIYDTVSSGLTTVDHIQISVLDFYVF